MFFLFGLPYFMQGFICSYFPSPVQVLPYSDGQDHNCVHAMMGLHWPDQSWVFNSDFFPYSFLVWVHHEISWCLPFLRRSQTWRFCRGCCRWSRIFFPCRYTVHSTSQFTLVVIYTILKSVRGHAAGMSSLLRSDHLLDGLYWFSCVCQCSPSWGWIARWMLLPFSSYQNWHSRFLPDEYYYKVILLRRSFPQFTCIQICCMSPCRNFIQSHIPGCRLVLHKSLVQSVLEYCWDLQVSSSCRWYIQVKAEGNYLIPLVMLKIFWTGDLKVSSLRAS